MWNLKLNQWTFYLLFVKLGGTAHKTTLVSNTNCRVRGVPKSTLALENSLGLIELPDCYYTHSMVYYNEKIHIKTSQRKRCIGQSYKHRELHVSSCLGVNGQYFFPGNNVWQLAWSIANQRLSTKPWCPEIFIGLHSWTVWDDLSFSAPPGGRADTVWT